MKCTYSMAVIAKCPKGGRDEYRLEVECDQIIEVERLIEMVSVATEKPIFQEALTEHIAESLDGEIGDVAVGTVRTTGVHSGVRAVVEEDFGG